MQDYNTEYDYYKNSKIDKKLEAKNKLIIKKLELRFNKKYNIWEHKVIYSTNRIEKEPKRTLMYKEEYNDLVKYYWLNITYFRYWALRRRDWMTFDELKTYRKRTNRLKTDEEVEDILSHRWEYKNLAQLARAYWLAADYLYKYNKRIWAK